MTGERFLPYGRQQIDEDDIAAVAAVLRGDWLTQGPAVRAFEEALAARVGAARAVACANGTAALHLAYLALGLGPGDAVVVPANTFLATASSARLCGAEVAFADVDPATGLMGPEHAEAAIARAKAAGWRVRALAPVHFAGQTAPMAELGSLAAAHGLAVVEDACHAIGSLDLRPDGSSTPVGSCAHGTLTVFSFHPVKTVAAGEGGAVTGNDPELMARVRRFCNHGMVKPATPGEADDPEAGFAADGTANPWYYEMPEPGLNYRLSDIHAALVLSQMRRLDGFVARRAALIDLYAERLAPLAPLVEAPARVPWCRPAWHLCVARIDFAHPILAGAGAGAGAGARIGRAQLMAGLRAAGIGTQVHYIPVHRQPYWRRRYGVLSLPGAEAYYARALSLPLFPGMTDAEAERVVFSLKRELGL